MNKKIQMIIFVSISFVFVIILWFNFFYKSIPKKNNIGQEIDGIKNDVLDVLQKINTTTKNALNEKNKLGDIKQIINKKIEEQNLENNKDKLIQIINKKIDEKSYSNQNEIYEKTEYQYEPWGIKFEYPNNMTKKISNDAEKIEIIDNNDEQIKTIIYKYNQKIEKIIDTTKYTKTTYNNTEFFETSEKIINNIYKKDYYTQIDAYSYKIEIMCPHEKTDKYLDILNITPKSLSKLEKIL